jgi:hypothetical protein
MLRFWREIYAHPENLKSDLKGVVDPSPSSFRELAFTIPPWLLTLFWDNMLNSTFADFVVQQFINALTDLSRAPSERTSKTGEKEISVNADAICLSLAHIFVSCRHSFNVEPWLATFKPFFDCPVQNIVNFAKFLDNMTRTSLHTKAVFQLIICQTHGSHLLQNSLPLFGTTLLLRMFRFDAACQDSLFLLLSEVLSENPSTISSLFLLHFVILFVTIYPGVGFNDRASGIRALSDQISNQLAHQNPISEIVSVTGTLIQAELDHPGLAYFRNLQYLAECCSTTDGALTVFFDPGFRLFPNLMYAKRTYNTNLDYSFVKWVRFYIAAKLNSNRRLSPEECFDFCTAMDFRQSTLDSLVEKYGLTDSGGAVSVPRLDPPVIPANFVKFPVAFDVHPNTSPIDVDGNQFLYTIPARNVFKTSVVQPLQKYMAANAAENVIRFPVFAFGDDYFISNVLLSYVLSVNENPEVFAKSIITFYVFPLSDKRNSIPDYIAADDPVYLSLVHKVFPTVSTIAPTMEENSPVSFTTIGNESFQYDNNLWFCNPSPGAVLQFCIQHYLMFAREVLALPIWKCVMVVDGTIMVVPFLISLHIGSQFDHSLPQKEPPPPRKFVVTRTLFGGTVETVEHSKAFGAALWAINTARKIGPKDPYLRQEIALTSSDIRSSDANDNEKCFVEHVMKIVIESKEVPFPLKIDDRKYPQVTKIAVSPMEDVLNPTQQMSIRVATFADIQR